MSAQGQWIQNRYHLIEILGEGGMGVVWRAFDRLTGQTVALKQVRQSPHNTSPHDTPYALTLAREFQTLSTLRHPHIISVLDYGFDEGQPYLTMTLLEEGASLSAETVTRLARAPHEVLLDILAALTYLHRRGVIHCDLKPSNVLIDASGVVRLIDFGIASAPDGASKSSGTINYLAPELLTGAPLSMAADLYAVGVMAYEFYAGRHPFEGDDVSGILVRVLYDEPDLSPIPPNIRPWMTRLLSKTASERYGTASAAIWALCNALDISLPPESADIRESFLQSARFIGRERELSTLKTHLASALEGSGAALLVNGESGVGKSRLVEEVRVQALVGGARVVRGQAAEGGGLAYQVWRDILPTLLLDAQPSTRETAVLSLIIPDIHHLTGQVAPKRLPKDAHRRLPRVLAGLIRAQSLPLVMIFEDIQWSSESLSLLSEIIPLVSERRLLILITQRSDEQPSLPPELAACEVIHLERLTPEDVAALSGAILGDVGRSAGLVSQLQRETEGNVFFLVEMMRALAEEVGSLDDIAPDSLFTTHLTGGIRALMRRKFDRLPAWARPWLNLSALMGRRLDPAILAHIPVADAPPLGAWLTVCADCALIEVSDGVWRFCHDKIREALRDDLTDVTELHAQIAAAIEAAYPQNPVYVPLLALHWAGADDWARAMQHIRVAVDGWRAVSAAKEAQSFLTQMLEKRGEGVTPERAELLIFLGEMYIEVGFLPQAYESFSVGAMLCRKLGLDALLAAALTGLAYFEFRIGKVVLALTMLAEALASPKADPLTRIRALNLKTVIYETPPPPQDIKILLDEAMALSIQHDLLEGRLLTYQNLTPYHILAGDIEAALRDLKIMVELAEQSGNSAMASAAYVNLSEIYLGMGDISPIPPLLERLAELLDQTGDLFLGAWIWKLRAQLSRHQGDFPAAIDHFRQAIAAFEAMGAVGEVSFVRSWLVLYLVESGKAVEAAAHLPLLLTEARHVGNTDVMEITVGAYALVAMMMGDTAQAADWHSVLNRFMVSVRGSLSLDMITLLDNGLDPEDISDAAARARYPDLSAAFESLADSGW